MDIELNNPGDQQALQQAGSPPATSDHTDGIDHGFLPMTDDVDPETALAMHELGQRIAGLRDAMGYSAEQFADLLGEDRATYISYEETGFDVPISLLMHIAKRANVDMGVLLTGHSAHLNTFQVVRAGQGRQVDRFPGYHFQDLAYAYANKTMQPLLVTLQPSDEPAALVTHRGQEFNYVTEGTVILVFADREIELHVGDSVYFNPQLPHGQHCGSDEPATFVTIIME